MQMMITASAGPTRKDSRQPSGSPITFRNSSETGVPISDPAQ